MIIRSKAPLRLGLAGGGTDISPYCDIYGGVVLNATINLYAYCTIETTETDKIVINAPDIGKSFESNSDPYLKIDGVLDLHKGVYNRIVKEFRNGNPLSFTMTTYADVPAGSGLGSSSTMVVAILNAFVEWLNLPLGEYDLAYLAYQIERYDIGLAGGKQDQYAATFGGFNFIEFYENNRVIVNPLRIKEKILNEFESSFLLYFTGSSRDSAKIISDQQRSTEKNHNGALNSMHDLKKEAYKIKEAILKGDFMQFSSAFSQSWESKKNTSTAISNPILEEIYSVALANGALSGKVSGAGGGGFMMFFINPVKKVQLISKLNQFNGKVMNFVFVNTGCIAWKP